LQAIHLKVLGQLPILRQNGQYRKLTYDEAQNALGLLHRQGDTTLQISFIKHFDLLLLVSVDLRTFCNEMSCQ